MLYLAILISLVQAESNLYYNNNFLPESIAIQHTLDFKTTTQNSNLTGIQDSIYKAFVYAVENDDPARLDSIGTNLEVLAGQRNLNIISYWRAYQAYYMAIYFLAKKEESNAEKLIDQHVDLLEEVENKNAEEYALLALIRSFSIQFESFIRAPFISSRVEDDLEKARQLDPENLRVTYVLASSDFYTPKAFGGGQKTESLLLKALSLPAQKIKNPVVPSWGHRESYELLLQYYIREARWENAETLHDEAIEKYPDNYRIEAFGKEIEAGQ